MISEFIARVRFLFLALRYDELDKLEVIRLSYFAKSVSSVGG